jgi:hypothetical protein
MANGNFVVQNGLQVGPLTIDAATGSISTTGAVNISGGLAVSTINKNDSSISINDNGTGSNVSIIIDGSVEHVLTNTLTTLNTGLTINGNLAVNGSSSYTGDLLPTANVTYALGSLTKMWKDVYVGPGTLYINGTAVLSSTTTGTPTINVTASAGQNLAVATNGGGILQLDGGAAGGGYIQVKSPMQIGAGSAITSSDGNAIAFANQIAVDALTSKSANTDLVITAAGTGKVQINDDMQVTGNLTVTGSTTTINTTNLSVADNIIDLNSTVTSGTPTLDAGIRVLRGDQNAVQIKWSESAKTWQATTDGATYSPLLNISSGAGNVTISANGSVNLTTVGTAQTVGSSTAIPVVTTDAYGRVTAMTSSNVSIPSGALTFTGDVTGSGNTGSSTALSIASSAVTNAMLAGSIADTKLSTIATAGKVSNSATTAASANTASAIVARDASGNFTAGTITAALTGNTTGTHTGAVVGNASTATALQTSRTIALTGDATASGSFDGSANYSQALTLATVNSNVGAFGSATAIPVVTVNAKGLVTAISTVAISGSLTFTGDVTGTGSTGGSTALTIANGSVTNAKLANSSVTVNGTAIALGASGTVTAAAGTLTGSSLASGVTASSLTSVGTLTGLTVSGTTTVPSITKSGTNGSGDIGQSNNTFATVYATTFSGVSTTAKYADLAENYQGDKTYAPGTVVMFGGQEEVTVADADTRAVAGVVSTNPAHLMNGGLTGANVVPVALQGRVPCMVIGPVKKGDMLVAAGHGYAKSSANPQMGQVIGKALYDFPGTSKAVIEVVVGRI